jgi:glutamate/tyrosine decarboxylase-like PLP-dependent enzyme
MADDTFRITLGAALEHSLAHLDNLDTAPVGATAGLADLRARLGRPLAYEGVAPAQVIADLARDVEGGIIGSAGGRFYAWVVGGALPAALAADWLTAAWDQNAGLYAAGPAAAVVEEVAGAWIKDLLGLPGQASFALVTGCQMAHVTCLAAARHALLTRRGWDVAIKGLYGAPPVRLITTREGHGSVDRAVRLLGLGRQQVVELPTDAEGRMRVDALEQAFAADPAAPAIVLLQAGDVNIGAFDRFEAVIPIARRHGAWVHVDGAIGLWAAASPRYRHLLAGAAGADSWATDGHKWLNVPYDCGYAFVADAESHRASMSHRAPYLTHDDHARDQMDWNPEWSRRARGFPTYAALRELGRQGIAELVERCCEHAHALVTRLGALPGAEVVWLPVINQGLVRFTDDRRTDDVIAAAMATGEVFFGGTTWRGIRAMRVSVSNWRTSEGDVERAVRAIKRVLGEGRTS